MSWLTDSAIARILVIAALAALAHIVLRAGHAGADRLMAPPNTDPGRVHRVAALRHPKVATLLSLAASTLTFAIWFVAVGLMLGALDINLTAYFATATVIGLAIGFGSQGLVQDVVIGLTLIFTDAVDVGDMVEVSGQVGRVERVGLRFTTLTNFLGQTVFIPNRNIAVVGRYRRDVVRAFVDVQLPAGADADDVAAHLHRLARGLRAQHPTAIVSEPDLVGEREAEPAGWRYIRLRFRLWPGQQALVEPGFRQRVVAYMRTLDEGYADWMVTVTLRA
ncbi:MAG TPA: mechanosensitive ion channel domain-containing protein [Longimicrobiales bacterium]|nr:mechanosensitive ion channel domain-containing protein [Longimicrobiales bacterium]